MRYMSSYWMPVGTILYKLCLSACSLTSFSVRPSLFRSLPVYSLSDVSPNWIVLCPYFLFLLRQHSSLSLNVSFLLLHYCMTLTVIFPCCCWNRLSEMTWQNLAYTLMQKSAVDFFSAITCLSLTLSSVCWYWFTISIGRYLNKSYHLKKGQTTTITSLCWLSIMKCTTLSSRLGHWLSLW